MTNTYIVTSYSLKATKPYVGRKTEVSASSPEAAIDAMLKAGRYASKTKRWQRHPDPIVRDNAHWQVDYNGFCGASAQRAEIDGRSVAEIDAEQHAASPNRHGCVV